MFQDDNIISEEISVCVIFVFLAEQDNSVNAVWEARRPAWSKFTEGGAGKATWNTHYTKHASGKYTWLILTRRCIHKVSAESS